LTLEKVTYEMLGSCERVTVAKEKTTMVSDGKQATSVEERINLIRSQIQVGVGGWVVVAVVGCCGGCK
jgi:hypothetical protein